MIVLAALSLLLAMGSTAAVAAEPASAAKEELFRASGFKMAGDATRMRIVLHFDREPQARWFLLRGPHRLVVDLPESLFAIDPEELEPRGLIRSVRYGHLDAGRSRMIFGSSGPFTVEDFRVLENESSPGHRLVIDMVAAPEAAFDAALAAQAGQTASTAAGKTDRLRAPETAPDNVFTIAIDPGHGGIDGGAESASGTSEKDITLAFALELRQHLQKSGGYKLVLTRERDEFLRLDERVRIARQAGADLFVSIHADSIRLKGIHGATVYTVSDRASDEEARALAERENLADSIAGVEVPEANQEVADILADLVRRETHNFSIRFARSLVGELSDAIDMINNPHRQAGFRVLRAPDVPSVLVELGYLSNARDEKRLKDPEWRRKVIGSIAAAIDAFAEGRLRAGG